jgi:hypothetical protein
MPMLPPGLGPAAERFARTTLRKSAQTQRTYASTYARFTTWLAAYTELADPPLAAFTADALAAYLDELELTKAPATVKKERLRSTVWRATCTRLARSTRPRS